MMATLSESDLTAIDQYPLDTDLEFIRLSLIKIEYDWVPPDGFGGGSIFEKHHSIYLLLGALSVAEVTPQLGPINDTINVSEELSRLALLAYQQEYDYDNYGKLVKQVLQHAPEISIWMTVFDIIAKANNLPPLNVIIDTADPEVTTITVSDAAVSSTAEIEPPDSAPNPDTGMPNAEGLTS